MNKRLIIIKVIDDVKNINKNWKNQIIYNLK